MFDKKINYDKEPEIRVRGYDNEVFSGYEAIRNEIAKRVSDRNKAVVILEFYPGVRADEVTGGIGSLFDACFNAEDCMFPKEKYAEMISPYMTNDRVFGIMNDRVISDFYDRSAVEEMRERISESKGKILVYGTGASLLTKGDLLIYADLARWEIQTRYKSGMTNLNSDNANAPFLSKYKQGFFLEWRMADKLKNSLFDSIDLLLDTNVKDKPVMITGEAFRSALKCASFRPFRLVPYFDPGVWGGQWMKTVCDLPKDKENYAWSFDGVPEENSLYFRFGGVRVELPAMDLVLYRPHELLGEYVYDAFGAEFPIRFDFLDTIEGQNLSLQVHPTLDYIRKTFGMKYTQDESYYILDCAENACVYLGLKKGVDPESMLSDLREAQKGGPVFDAEKYVNKIPAKKHDHFLIPAGTVHCSGAGSMVLEISATPYIFTFKLWDWARLGLDGLPRPIHIEHGSKVIQWDRDTDWVMKNLVGRTETVSDSDGVKAEHTGLHELEFIDTVRYGFYDKVELDTNGGVNVLNLVDGEEAEIISPTGAFDPFTVHYAETFIIPAAVGKYVIRATGNSKGQCIMALRASVRSDSLDRIRNA